MTPPLPSKADVIAALAADLATELAALERVAAATRAEVGSDETRSEGQYDTRAIEASYLARGQATRIAELRRLIAWVDRFDPRRPLDPPVVQVGALLAVQGHRRELLFVAPTGGGRLQVGPDTVRIISPRGPMGQAMAELEVGDEVEVDSTRGVQSYELLAIR
jgi:transcription elongation GreA/GreB family factor